VHSEFHERNFLLCQLFREAPIHNFSLIIDDDNYDDDDIDEDDDDVDDDVESLRIDQQLSGNCYLPFLRN
jgi:hypothetical protein